MSDLLAPAFLEESAADLYENAPCGYLSTLPDGTIVKLNGTFLRWTGFDRDALIGDRRFQQLLTVAGRVFHETHLTPLLLVEGQASEIALDLVCANGKRLPTLVNIVQHKDTDGRPRVNRLTVFNARRRRKYERELVAERRRAEHAAQVKTDFLSTISHEIRTPLGAIMAVTHLLERTSPNARQAKLLRMQRSSSDSLLKLVNEVLDFSKIEAGQVALEPAPFSVRNLIYQNASRLEIHASEKEIELTAQVDDDIPPWLVGDDGKIGQVLTNLIGNAIKFTAEGCVSVAVRQRALTDSHCTIEVSVTDTGIGIPSDRLETIFDAFTQVSSDIGVRYGGTGLGLAISQRLLGLHGTELTVDSTPGVGSRFAFELTLPVAADSPRVEPPKLVERVRGTRILVAEDNPINVYVLSRCLEDWGVEFDVVGNGREAVDRVRERDYDLVLMDLRMPEMDGYEATRRIRNFPEPRFTELPIIALSATVRIGQQDRVGLAGFTDFLGKPYEPGTLLTRIARFSGKGRVNAPVMVPRDSHGGASLAEFSIEHLRSHADGESSVAELLNLVQENLRNLRERLGRALDARDLKLYETHARGGRTAIDLLQATTLNSATERGRRLLAQESEPSDLVAVKQAIMWSVDDILDAMTQDPLEPPNDTV